MVTPVTHDKLICEIATRKLYFLWVIYKRPQPVQGEAPCKIYCNEVKPEGSPDVTLWIPWHLEGDISIVEAPKKAMFFGSFLERDFSKCNPFINTSSLHKSGSKFMDCLLGIIEKT